MKASKLHVPALALGLATLVHSPQALAQLVTADFATLAGSALSVPGNGITGSVLAPGVTASSLTSVGTLVGLTVLGPTSINASGAASTTLGNSASSLSSVVLNGGAGYANIGNAASTMGTQNGGTVQTTANTVNVRAFQAGTAASNGSTGTMVVGAGGGYSAYNSSQTVSGSIGGLLDNRSYTNKINGNTLVDGNAYINGTTNFVSSNSANSTVVGGAGSSVLAGATTAVTSGTGMVVTGATATQTVVDSRGKLTNVTGVASQSTAALTLTNGYGNTHGLVVTESQATLSGGTRSSSLTMADNGATFSDANTGAPVQVHGVKDGTSDFDAVNVRQFAGSIAAVTAMANIPHVDQDKEFAIGVGVGGFMDKTALAAGMSYRFNRNGVFKASLSSAMSNSNTETVGLGVGWSF